MPWNWRRKRQKSPDPPQAVEMLLLASLRFIRTVTVSGLGERIFFFPKGSYHDHHQ